MGYTRYWEQTGKNIDIDSQKLIKELVEICKNYGVIVKYEYDVEDDPKITSKLIHFNGVEDEGHETFLIDKSKGFNFCKTARKPYDDIVHLSLITLNNNIVYDVSDDGINYSENKINIIKDYIKVIENYEPRFDDFNIIKEYIINDLEEEIKNIEKDMSLEQSVEM